MLEQEVLNSISYWKEFYKNVEPKKVTGKKISNKLFNEIALTLYNEDDFVYDFGAGDGWGLFELFFTKPYKEGIGSDTNYNAISLAAEIAKLSGFEHRIFFGLIDINAFQENVIQAIFSSNTLDVINDISLEETLKGFDKALKKEGKILISLNPYISKEQAKSYGWEEKSPNKYYVGDALVRFNRTNEEWINIFNKRFKVVKTGEWQKDDDEKDYIRRLFLLERK